VSAGRIKFAGNPWKAGHPVKRAVWTAKLEPEGLRFHLHLESADYDAEDDREDDEVDSDWKSRIVWTNYGSCSLSSTKWGHAGFLAATPGKPIDLEKLAGTTFRVDRMKDEIDEDLELEEMAFGIYLLGHDAVANHRIAFVKRHGKRTYDVRWRADIALAYAGSYDLKHALDAALPKLRLQKIAIGKLGKLDPREALAEVVVGAKRFRRVGNAFV
jgi:hypothetical protein